ncbi:MAG: class I adenylate-forming enzyme family protein [Pseudomonadota bacterium]
MNLADVLRINAANHGERIAIVEAEETLTYTEAFSRVRSFAGQLRTAGASSGSRVGLAMKDHSTHLLAHFAVAYIGAIILPVDHRWTDPEKRGAARAFGIDLLVTDGETLEGVPSLSLDAGHEALAETGEIAEASDAALLISLSSGTTGRPKGALVTHENLYERFVSQWVAIGYDASDCFALLTPLFFGAGRSFGMSMLTAGGTVLLAPPPLKPDEIVAALSQPRVSATFLPPTLLRRLLPLHRDRALLANLNYLIVSGEPLHAGEAAECLDKICPNIYSYYASSEGGGISVLKAAEIRQHADTVGQPTFRTDVEIVDDKGEVLPGGSVGRLRYRGPGVARCFLDEDGRERSADTGGWFYPGDLAERLDNGMLALRGRDKDVIIRGGVNIYPAEIERCLQNLEGVAEVAVTRAARMASAAKWSSRLSRDPRSPTLRRSSTTVGNRWRRTRSHRSFAYSSSCRGGPRERSTNRPLAYEAQAMYSARFRHSALSALRAAPVAELH